MFQTFPLTVHLPPGYWTGAFQCHLNSQGRIQPPGLGTDIHMSITVLPGTHINSRSERVKYRYSVLPKEYGCRWELKSRPYIPYTNTPVQ